jgi:hypothetical protein
LETISWAGEMKHLWEKDRKTIYRELLDLYLDEGYSRKEAKRLATEETDEIKAGDFSFVSNIMDEQEC